ncbi:hypothetical protein ACF08M_13110 [Streptomyces sp. NPDC015032]|uniref:hypothetical protein n=1 Tax=Streptomyces sp. NPDC015032 TaxID=3364937 RepID=UPI0036FF4C89
MRWFSVISPKRPDALAAVLALTACAVLAGATSLLAVGEWITDTPAHVLHRLGVRPESISTTPWRLPSQQRWEP